MLVRFARSLAVVLLAWQAMVAQTHLHARALGVPAVSALAASSTGPQRPDGPLDCPVCREVAHAGQYLAAPPVLFTPPATVALWRAPQPLPTAAVAQASHRWRSRAPPTLSVAA